MKIGTIKNWVRFAAIVAVGASVGIDVSAAEKPQGCTSDVKVMPDKLIGKDASAGCDGSSKCQDSNGWIIEHANAYEKAVEEACGQVNKSLASATAQGQAGSQKNIKEVYNGSISSLEPVIAKGQKFKEDSHKKATDRLKALEQLPEARTSAAVGAISRVKRAFKGPGAFDSTRIDFPPLNEATGEVKKEGAAFFNHSDFQHKLALDLAKRKQFLDGYKQARDAAQGNEEKSGEAKKEEGKGMDPSSLMGPLAALAGLAQKKPETPAAESGLSDPAAAANAAAAATPAEAKMAATSIPGTSIAKGASRAEAAKAEAGKADEKKPEASQYASGLSSTNPVYKDAFTGLGANGTSPGTFSPTTGGGGSSGASSSGGGAAGSGAGAAHSPSEEEALTSFGGGGLNFSGGASSSSGSHAAEGEGVKDFLQGAETSLGAADETPAGELSAEAEAGVEGEDGAELFRRVRSALERSQRKGSVMSGLSGPKDPRYR